MGAILDVVRLSWAAPETIADQWGQSTLVWAFLAHSSGISLMDKYLTWFDVMANYSLKSESHYCCNSS